MRVFLLTCFVLVGCQSVPPVEEEPAPEYIIVELPLDELRKTCGLWSGTSGCIWMNHKFVLKQPGMEV